MPINWFPGHMVKTKKQIKENLKFVDAIIEIRDARIIISSKNPDIDKICKDKPRIILLNKSDLAEEKITKDWINILSNENVKVISGNSMTGKGLNNIKPALDDLLKNKHDNLKKKGIKNIVTRAMVVGIPNVGKSSFINRIANANRAKVGNKPGVTRNKQWIKTRIGIELLDTPGILWPKFEDEEVGLKLAFTGAIKDEIMDIETLSLRLIERLQNLYPDKLVTRYKLSELSNDPLENLNAIGKRRGTIISGGEIDYNRLAVMILDEFRSGKLGPISLERPGELND